MYKQVLALAIVLCAGTSLAGDANVSGLASTCFSCHGINGVSVGQTMPNLAGQNAEYLQRVMLEQKRDARYSSIMGRLLKTYSDEEIIQLAGYFAALPWVAATAEPELRLVNAGRQTMKRLCQNCHGPNGNKTENTPRLAGQWPDYLALEAMKYTDPTFHRNKPSERMAEKIGHLTVEEVKAVSHYLGTRK
ncbi:MAG: c-type cytochrome [Rhodocyclaceae bacterium]|nr:c-type cytochrome [Rhodocyclaceae bacterium]